MHWKQGKKLAIDVAFLSSELMRVVANHVTHTERVNLVTITSKQKFRYDFHDGKTRGTGTAAWLTTINSVRSVTFDARKRTDPNGQVVPNIDIRTLRLLKQSKKSK